jgi:hypothetical protein
MAYNPGYESYDPYLTRSLSRRQSMGYPGTPYPSVYPDGVAATDVSIFHLYGPFPSHSLQYQDPYQVYGPPGNAVVPVSRRLTNQGEHSFLS